jgi:catechol 2,3-dioxygenase-like lactoylglutathione lyase family enzyme
MDLETKIDANVTQAVPFFAVSNIEESVRYYVDLLGFTMTRKWIDGGRLRWCWLEIGSAALMLQEFRRAGPDSWVPAGKVGEGVSIYFQCGDALAVYRAAARRGANASRPAVGNGLWETLLSDPDGYKIVFVSPTDLPEDTEFSEREDPV